MGTGMGYSKSAGDGKAQGDIVIVGGARDYHAVDWYRTIRKVASNRRVMLLTDTIDGEGFESIVTGDDDIERLFVVDSLLLRHGSRMADLWRNLLKLIVLPLQILLLRRFVAKNPTAILHAHPMYYMFLCWMGGVRCGVTPQGSEILVRPERSKLYGFFARRSLQAATFVTVDSTSMKEAVYRLSGVQALVVQNGIDTVKIRRYAIEAGDRTRISSIRGFTPLYRIRELFDARNRKKGKTPLTFVYPFKDDNYYAETKAAFTEGDEDLGRLKKDELYVLLAESLLIISIPSSDSSPRGVYEAIFAGACVAAVYNHYMDPMPTCMRERIFVVDLEDDDWFAKAVSFARGKNAIPYEPSVEAVEQYDQYKSLKCVVNRIYG